MQNLVGVVNSGERKMLGALFAVGTEGSGSLRHGHTTLPAHREHLNYLVTSTEQGKPVSLPARGSEGRSVMEWISVALASGTTLPNAKACCLLFGASRERT